MDFGEAIGRILDESHLVHPGQLADLAAAAGRDLGLRDLRIYLAEYSQRFLNPQPANGEPPLEIDVTVAGRAFVTGEVIDTGHGGDRQVWVPMIDGADRVGVMTFLTAEVTDELRRDAWRLASLLAPLIIVKSQYTDEYRHTARRQPMSVASEMHWRTLPPLTFTTRDVAIAAIAEPAYDLGGDVFDYALTGDIAHLVVADAAGHGLAALAPAAAAIGSIRHSRRHDLLLADTYRTANEVVAERFERRTFVTACLAQLDVTSGRLTWINAGHPQPLLVRQGKVVAQLDCRPSPPLGVGRHVVEQAEMTLQAWDRVVLFTDGVTEGRRPEREPFGHERLAEAINRESLAEHGPAETVRRLARDILNHHAHGLNDDFTILTVEYRGHLDDSPRSPASARLPHQRSI
jgi:hypothetical protein